MLNIKGETYHNWPHPSCPGSHCLHHRCRRGWCRCLYYIGTALAYIWIQLQQKKKNKKNNHTADLALYVELKINLNLGCKYFSLLTALLWLIRPVPAIIFCVTFPPERNALVVLAHKLQPNGRWLIKRMWSEKPLLCCHWADGQLSIDSLSLKYEAVVSPLISLLTWLAVQLDMQVRWSLAR